jgi:GNAT superfamily N-acetyltransferase
MLPSRLDSSRRHRRKAVFLSAILPTFGPLSTVNPSPCWEDTERTDLMKALKFRRATLSDVPVIVAMLADDALGSARENAWETAPQPYRDAFAEIDADPNQFLCVAEEGNRVVATLQLTFIAGLSRNGAKRGLVEAVRVSGERRGEGFGEALLLWAIAECRSRGCSLVQLTTDKTRLDAHRFYERLGFVPSHVGYKLQL